MNSGEKYPFGDLLKGFRNRAGRSRQELADMLGMHVNMVAHWETGNHLPKRQRIKQLATALNLSEQEEEELLVAALQPNIPHELATPFLLPPTHPKSIVQRASIVNDIYAILTQEGTTAVVLTGLGGVGKSTLAALVYKYAEQQRKSQAGPFTAPALWFRGDLSMTMTDFARMLLTSLGKAAVAIESLPPRHQAVALFNAIKTTSLPRLIVIDQFEELMVRKTSDTLTNSAAGFRDWVQAINSEECASRILLTSRRWLQERQPVCLQEYVVGSLQSDEGIELLQKNGVHESEHELFEAVEHCGGHPLALVLLASLMGFHKLTLQDVWKKAVYTQFWQENIARDLLNTVYQQQLDDIERQLLCAFSIYREPVPIDAVLPLLVSDKIATEQIFMALNSLLTQHLLQTSTGGYYRPHTIVSDYALENLRKQDGQSGTLTLHIAHLQAARYHQQLAHEPASSSKKRQLHDLHLLIEMVWHLCQAEEWQQAYTVIEQESLHADLCRLGGITTLLEIYQFMLPLEKWNRDTTTPGAT
jgi:transcriptional regulator with XRE-family HTH domain